MPPAAAAAPVAAGAAAAGGATAAAGTAAAVGAGAAAAGTAAAATGAGLATAGSFISGAVSVGAGLATIFGGSSGVTGERLELPAELEELQLKNYVDYMGLVADDIKQTQALIPFIKDRVDTMDKLAQATTPSPTDIQKLQAIDRSIAERFGQQTARDVQAGIITQEAKTQAQSLQQQIALELQNQGKQVDETMLTDIQEQIRRRMSPTSSESKALEDVRSALMAEVRTTGDVMRRDPAVERQLQEQRDALTQDLALRGIDPNSTAGRRAMQEFAQRATETRFTVGEQLAAGRISRLSELTNLVSQNVNASDISRQAILSATQQLGQTMAEQGTQRRSRIAEMSNLINAPVQNVLTAMTPEQQQAALDMQRAQLALGASAQQQSAFQQGIATQAQLVQLQQLPVALRARLLESKGTILQAFEKLGAQKFTGNTLDLMKAGQIPGIATRTIPKDYNPYAPVGQNIRSSGYDKREGFRPTTTGSGGTTQYSPYGVNPPRPGNRYG